MNKRGRNAQRKGEGLPPNSENADGFEIRALQHQLDRTRLNLVSPNTNTKVQTFNGTKLPCFFNLVPAEAKLKELNTSQNTSQNTKYRMFAFDWNAEGAKMFVVGELEDFIQICFRRRVPNRSSGYNYEVLMDGQLMKLYCDCEYLEVDNPGKDKDKVLEALLYYICQAYQQVPKPNHWNVTLGSQDLLVETCHRDGKASFHIKVPEQFGVVTSMSAQRAFWSRVVTLAINDRKSIVDGDRVRAEELRVFRNWKGKPIDDWVVDFSVYKDHSQCFRNLKAAKHPKQSQFSRPQDYLVPLGKSLQEITEDKWKESLIMNVASDARTLQLPKEWLKTNEIDQSKSQAIRMFDSEIHRTNANMKEDVRRVETDDNQFKIFSSLLNAIDPGWSVANRNLLQVRYGYLNPKVDILPKYVYLFPRTKYCPIKKGNHDTCCSWLKVAQDGTMIISCFSSNHGDKPNYGIYSHEEKKLTEKEAVMIETWGVFKWGKALNSRYAFMKNPPTSSKCILECHENSIEYHNTDHLTTLFANCRAYSLQYQSRKSNGTSAQPNDNDQQQPQKVLNFTNPFKCWLHAANRRDINRVIFDPSLKDCSGDINTWHGFAVIPKHSDNPCPRLLNHIRVVLVSNNEIHHDFLLNWLTWIVQRPGEKTGVAVVFVSDQGTGKSTLINVLQKIFGIHCLQITNSQHLFTPFSAHMDNRVLIVLNESTWGGDKAHEGWVKASITDGDSLSQAKFGEIKSIKNYWNLMFVSNQIWCFPASEDNRRFFCPTVSNERIGDHQYFNELHHEIDNGGVEEFLYFLMNRQLPDGWKPAEFLPKRTKMNFLARMEDRKNGALRWFIKKLKQREWTEYIPVSYDGGETTTPEPCTIISWDKTTTVSSQKLQRVWSLAREKDRELREYATEKDIKQLKGLLDRLFNSQKELFSSTIVFKTRSYKFASMQEIRKFITEFHGYDVWDDDEDIEEDECIRQSKKHKPSKNPIDQLRKPSRNEVDRLNHLCSEGNSSVLQYAKQIFGIDAMSIGENSNDSKMSVACSESEKNGEEQNGDQYMLSDEENCISEHALMEDIQGASDEDQDSNLAYRRKI